MHKIIYIMIVIAFYTLHGVTVTLKNEEFTIMNNVSKAVKVKRLKELLNKEAERLFHIHPRFVLYTFTNSTVNLTYKTCLRY